MVFFVILFILVLGLVFSGVGELTASEKEKPDPKEIGKI